MTWAIGVIVPIRLSLGGQSLYGHPVTRILLVRHGQSEWNASGRWQGRADPPLTQHGRRQAALASEAVGVVDAIVSSPLQRAHLTATIIAEMTGVGPVDVHDDLVERDAGAWTGLTLAEIDERYGADRLARGTPEGWEDEAVVLERVVRAVHAIAGAYAGGEVVVVTHGGVMFTLERHLLGSEARRIPNLGARWLEVGIDNGLRLGDWVSLLPEHGLVAAEEQV